MSPFAACAARRARVIVARPCQPKVAGLKSTMVPGQNQRVLDLLTVGKPLLYDVQEWLSKSLNVFFGIAVVRSRCPVRTRIVQSARKRREDPFTKLTWWVREIVETQVEDMIRGAG